MDKEFVKTLNENYLNCTSRKYIDKYDICPFDLERSIPLEKFIVLIQNIEKDKSDKCNIEFDMYENISFGKKYIRYLIKVTGDLTSQKQIYTQFAFDEYNYKNGLLFTVANIYCSLYQRDFEFNKKFNDLVSLASNKFINKKY